MAESQREGKVWLPVGLALLIAGLAAACTVSASPSKTVVRTDADQQEKRGAIPSRTATATQATPTATPTLIPSQGELSPSAYQGTPTPDPLRLPPPTRDIPATYMVQYGDSLNGIAGRLGVGAWQILQANGLLNPDLLAVGQVLVIPTPYPQDPSPSLKIIPDSELVYGPGAKDFNILGFIHSRGGYLKEYRETVEEIERTGPEIVEIVAQRYSVNPRMLLALLEFQSQWVTDPDPPVNTLIYPLGFKAYQFEGLFAQLSWAADELNHGYYLWRAGWNGPYLLVDGSVVNPGEGLNAATVGLQYLLSKLYAVNSWRQALERGGFSRTLVDFFGDPFPRAVEPLIPPDLAQPELQLPFEAGKYWSFTGGPHSAWGNWAGWAALDFAPPGFALGCVLSDEWVVAVAEGLVVRSDRGEVILDLDQDGYEQTGWVIQYMHIESRDRIAAGQLVQAGDRIGHPSCEGGVASGTHLHIARKYNGEWIPADTGIPFVMDGWISSGTGDPYDGILARGEEVLEACACRNAYNQISR